MKCYWVYFPILVIPLYPQPEKNTQLREERIKEAGENAVILVALSFHRKSSEPELLTLSTRFLIQENFSMLLFVCLIPKAWISMQSMEVSEHRADTINIKREEFFNKHRVFS